MSPFSEQADEVNTDCSSKVHSMAGKVRYFYAFYPSTLLSSRKISFQKMTFKFRETRGDDAKYVDSCSLVHLHVASLDTDDQVRQVLLSLKTQKAQEKEALVKVKTKIILYGGEAALTNFLKAASTYRIEVDFCSFIVYPSDSASSFSKLVGWIDKNTGACFNELPEQGQIDLINSWTRAVPERIDIWAAELTANSRDGIINCKQPGKALYESQDKTVFQLFASQLFVGKTAKELFKRECENYDQKWSVMSKLKRSFAEWGSFCCLNSDTICESTGMSSIEHTSSDQKTQLLYQKRSSCTASEIAEGEQVQKQSSHRGVLSVGFMNIDRWNDSKVSDYQPIKANDKRLDLFNFYSLSAYSRMGEPLDGTVISHFETASDQWTYVQIGEKCIQIKRPIELKIRYFGKIAIAINRESLSC